MTGDVQTDEPSLDQPERNAGQPGQPSRSRRATIGWILYDFANVIFAISVISLYFPLWVVNDAGGREANFAFATSTAMAAVFLIAPFFGTLVDQLPRRMPALVLLTIACCTFTVLLGSGGLITSLIFFVIAATLFQLCLIVYDSFLPIVSTPETRGKISGFGIAAGFAGSLTGIVIGITVLAFDDSGKPLIFRIAGTGFLLGALPCFLWVREPRRDRGPISARAVFGRTMSTLRSSARGARTQPGVGRFLAGRIFYNDAINTLMVFMSIYATEEIGFTETETQLVLLAGVLAGPVGALVSGNSVDRRGPKQTLGVLLSIWVAALAASALIPLLGLPPWLFWIVAPIVGIGLGGTSTTERTYLLRLVPPHQVGQFLGLYVLVGRFAAFISPLLWVLVADVLGLGRPAAVLALIVMVMIGRRIIAPIDDAPRVWDPSTGEFEPVRASA
jgi:UMF1 family MFS transporter